MAELSVLAPKHAMDTETSSEGGTSGDASRISDEKLEIGLDLEAKTRSKLRILAVLTALFVSLAFAPLRIFLNVRPER